MRLRYLEVPPSEEGLELPAGWAVAEIVTLAPSTMHGPRVLAVLSELEAGPTVEQLIRFAVEAGDNAVGVPGPVLRQAMRELGYDVPEPSPLQVATPADVAPLHPRRG